MKEYISKFSKLDEIGRIARGKSKHIKWTPSQGQILCFVKVCRY